MPYQHPFLTKTIAQDKKLLEETRLPIVTVSSTYIQDLLGFHDYPEKDTITDVVFSRAHYSMALAAAVQAWGEKIDPKKCWVVDPTNYVKNKQWMGVKITELIGKILARIPLLKRLKDLVDKFGRNKLPILESITPPLNEITQNVTKPILSFHIASGNILAAQGKTVFEMITDPHVREDYLNEAQRENMHFLVFNQETKDDFLQKAKKLEKKVDPNQIVVTGPPIDPRIIQAGKNKQPWKKGALHIALSTGGLGTNKPEIKKVLQQLLPEIKKPNSNLKLAVYAGTHSDIAHMVRKLAKKAGIKLNVITKTDPSMFYPQGDLEKIQNEEQIREQLNQASLSLVYHPQIIDANALLTQFIFPWADGFISKPSGDMAYDAVASGAFLLTLKEWGEWEHNIRVIFEKAGTSQEAQIDNILEQIKDISEAEKGKTWIEQAMTKTHQLDKIFYEGVKNINKTVLNFKK